MGAAGALSLIAAIAALRSRVPIDVLWRTDKAGTGCRRLTLTFVDCSSKSAEFTFR